MEEEGTPTSHEEAEECFRGLRNEGFVCDYVVPQRFDSDWHACDCTE